MQWQSFGRREAKHVPMVSIPKEIKAPADFHRMQDLFRDGRKLHPPRKFEANKSERRGNLRINGYRKKQTKKAGPFLTLPCALIPEN